MGGRGSHAVPEFGYTEGQENGNPVIAMVSIVNLIEINGTGSVIVSCITSIGGNPPLASSALLKLIILMGGRGSHAVPEFGYTEGQENGNPVIAMVSIVNLIEINGTGSVIVSCITSIGGNPPLASSGLMHCWH
jgi:hypothetical protein